MLTEESRNPISELARTSEVVASLEEINAKETVGETILGRLELLETNSKFNVDSRMIERGMEKILAKLGLNLSPEHTTDAKLAALIHDVGKSGPAKANEEESIAVIKLFAIDKISNINQTIQQTVADHFETEEGRIILANLESCGIDTNLSMRSFWDLHAQWTADLLENSDNNVTRRVRVIAASHHIDRDINPYNIDESDIPTESEVIGLSEYYIEALEERLLIAVDKYQAAVQRSKLTHDEAIGLVRKLIHSKFGKDPIMTKILEALDELGKTGNLFE